MAAGRTKTHGDTSVAEEFLIRAGQTLVCLGDSITQNPSGYCSLMAALIAAAFPERAITVVNVGVGGNKIRDLLERLDRDVLARKPDWVSVNVGINDVWHGLKDGGKSGTPLDAYRAGVDLLVDRLLAFGAKVVLLPPTVIEENPDSEGNRQLIDYRAAMRFIGTARGVLVAPTDQDFDQALMRGKAAQGERYCLTTDGVHLRPAGDAVVAVAVLKTLHFFNRLAQN